MDSIEPPSFSLGFDLDAASDPHGAPEPGLTVSYSDLEHERGLIVSDSDLELEPGFSSPALKRLRRGVRSIKKRCAKDDTSELLGCDEDRDDEDDIEEFSSPEDAPASTRSHLSSCSSKVPLHGSGVLSNQPSISRGKRKQSDVPSSSGSGSGISSVASLFQSSTRSPLRRFKLLDSDSEDDHPRTRRDLSGVTKTNDLSSKRKEPGSMPCTGDLLKDFSPANSKIQTPAQRRFQLLDSDSEDDHPSFSRDLSGVTKTNDSSSKYQPSVASKPKRKESGSMPSTGYLRKDYSPTISKSNKPALRRFQLIDLDSEDDLPSSSRDLNGVTKTSNSCSKDQPSVASKPKRKEPGFMPCTGDLWKDFSPVSSKIQTPALDDVCQDYFSSIKTSSTGQQQSNAVASSSNSGLYQQTGEFSDFSLPSPPSHRFFLHSDPRIHNLVRKRLPNFLPLGIFNDRESRREVCLIDYMNQFGSNESSKTVDSSSKSCRRRGQTKSKVSNGQESTHAPKDAGKRRVSANSGSAGHWFTSPEGRKVYVSKSGQEFSGQSAYRCYRKETGGGFNKSKRKRQPKKKAKN